jgi:hypothetical protein
MKAMGPSRAALARVELGVSKVFAVVLFHALPRFSTRGCAWKVNALDLYAGEENYDW